MKPLLLVSAVVACAPPSIPTSPDEPADVVHDVRGQALGTTWHVRWVTGPGAGPEDAAVEAEVQRVLAEVDLHMSTWRDDSELSRARRASGPMVVSDDTYVVVLGALELAAASGGAFDPTVQPLMELWGFHGAPRTALPSDEEIEQARAQVDWRRVQVARNQDLAATLDVGGTALDLSAIAKGHAVDRVHHAVSRMGLGSVFVEVGGEVRVSGAGAQAPLWRVGVDLPVLGEDPGSSLAMVAVLSNGAVATSGNYRNRYEVDGQALVHTMDPRVGRPVATPVASATVLAPDCRTADGLATALMVLSPDEGLALVERRPDTEAALLLFDGRDFALRTTSGVHQQIQVVSERVRPAP